MRLYLIACASIVFIVHTIHAREIKNAASAFMKFKTMEGRHKADWLRSTKLYHDNKFDLMKKHHLEWVDYDKKNINQWSKNTDCSADAKNEILSQQLERAEKLHKKQTADWQKFINHHQEESTFIHDKHQEELASFINDQ